MRSLLRLFVLVGIILAGEARAQQPSQPDTTSTRHVLKLRDGSTLVGSLVDSTADSLRFHTHGATITIARSTVAELREARADAMHAGEYWTENTNTTRLFFAPTGRMLKQGEGYFSDTYLFFLNTVVGVTPQFTMGGGMSVFPLENFGDNLFYITPKLGVVQRPRFNVAVGALAGVIGGLADEGTDASFGIVYGVATTGSEDNSMTFGVGVPFAGGDFADRPVFMVGGEARVSNRMSLLTENYILPKSELGGALSYGVRFFGEKLSVDLAFLNAPKEPVFPGVPYVSFAVKF